MKDSRWILTGAAGGLGSLLAKALHEQGVRLILVDANAQAVQDLASSLAGSVALTADLSSAAACDALIEDALKVFEGVDGLINLAGVSSFKAYEDEDPAWIEKIMQINVLAPMLLTRALLPSLLAQKKARIVNIGSVFGSIGFAYFSSYSASKFALRGFSEALRRELADTSVQVQYIAPRAIRTPLNNPLIMRMAKATKMNMDEPALVVARIIEALQKEQKECFIGFPESLFARINGLFPRLVDKALAANDKIAKTFATQAISKES